MAKKPESDPKDAQSEEKRRASIKRAGKAATGIVATTAVIATLRPTKAAHAYDGNTD